MRQNRGFPGENAENWSQKKKKRGRKEGSEEKTPSKSKKKKEGELKKKAQACLEGALPRLPF